MGEGIQCKTGKSLNVTIFKLLERKAVQGPAPRQEKAQHQHGLGVTWSSSEKGLGDSTVSQHCVLVAVRPVGSWGPLERALGQVREMTLPLWSALVRITWSGVPSSSEPERHGAPGARPAKGDKQGEGTGASLC